MHKLDFATRPPDVSYAPARRRRVLNVGAGSVNAGKIHAGFAPRDWHETRLDIDPATRPDLVGSITTLHGLVPDAGFDAVWCSHVIEHLPDHEVAAALAECRRILKPDGFAVITTPDLAAVARQLLAQGPDAVAYQSPAGPITALDMLFGHRASIRAGHGYMAHRTGFTVDRLGRMAAEAGFTEARVAAGQAYDLWAVLTMPDTDLGEVFASFGGTNLAALCG